MNVLAIFVILTKHLEQTKSQVTGYTCEGFILIESFEVERLILNPEILRWDDLSSAGIKDTEKGAKSMSSKPALCTRWKTIKQKEPR